MKAVRVLLRLEHKKRAVEIFREVERHVSSCLPTVTAVNATLGAVVGLVMFLLDMPNPALWGIRDRRGRCSTDV